MRWQYAIIYPDDSEYGWAWLHHETFGKSAFERMVVTLQKAGIRHLRLFPEPVIEDDLVRRLLRRLPWDDEPDRSEPILIIKGGFIWKPELLSWFDKIMNSRDQGSICIENNKPIIASCSYGLWESLWATSANFPEIEVIEHVPSHLMPVPSWDEKGILELAGKPSDRPHVVWVRRKLLPFLRFCANKGIHPNTITWLGFGVNLAGCFLLLFKSYLLGILATLVLVFSWVLDCADGSLARVAMKESPQGKKLDTVLGNLSNLTVFTALIVREYGDRPFLAFLLALFIVVGILIAYTIHERAPEKTSYGKSAVSEWLTKINHRDYTIFLFVLALFDALKVFIWLSLVGVHVYWIVELALRKEVFKKA
ncbi:MAG: CDP-alcohol phosphatidyltransferase family protein [Thermodesulforhabdaceae bacterium]